MIRFKRKYNFLLKRQRFGVTSAAVKTRALHDPSQGVMLPRETLLVFATPRPHPWHWEWSLSLTGPRRDISGRGDPCIAWSLPGSDPSQGVIPVIPPRETLLVFATLRPRPWHWEWSLSLTGPRRDISGRGDPCIAWSLPGRPYWSLPPLTHIRDTGQGHCHAPGLGVTSAAVETSV